MIIISNLGLRNVLIESDCLPLIQTLKSKGSLGEVDLILMDIAEMKQEVSGGEFTWTPWEGNQLPHLVATLMLNGKLSNDWNRRPSGEIARILKREETAAWRSRRRQEDLPQHLNQGEEARRHGIITEQARPWTTATANSEECWWTLVQQIGDECGNNLRWQEKSMQLAIEMLRGIQAQRGATSKQQRRSSKVKEQSSGLEGAVSMQPLLEAEGGNRYQADGGDDVSVEEDSAKSIGTEDNHLKLRRWRGGWRREQRCENVTEAVMEPEKRSKGKTNNCGTNDGRNDHVSTRKELA
ncbi:hypothetical protein AHAS_Ahas08G0084500 [Arachis hypogaea]